MKTHGPYLIRHADKHTFWQIAASGQQYGSWHFSAYFASTFNTKHDADRAISGMRIDKYGKSRCQIAPQAQYLHSPKAAAPSASDSLPV
jgi:hypothetical protein